MADLTPRLQSLLLRTLQEGEARRVGSDRVRRVDVRFAAATNRPLADLAAAGSFRWDLLFRLQGAEVCMPSLEARRHEFPFLVPRLVADVATGAGLDPPKLEEGLAHLLADQPWPGNFRQLRHALERGIWRCGSGPLGAGHVLQTPRVPPPCADWRRATRAFQREMLISALARNGHNVTATAAALGLTRPALYASARRLDVVLAEGRTSPPGGGPQPGAPDKGSSDQYSPKVAPTS